MTPDKSLQEAAEAYVGKWFEAEGEELRTILACDDGTAVYWAFLAGAEWASGNGLAIGPYRISPPSEDGNFWISKEGGEGMGVGSVKLIALIERFWNDEF
jgi:hypothetical protein